MQRFRRSTHTRRGAILPLVVLALVMLFGMASLAIDIAMMYMARERAQVTADAAALAAGRLLNRQYPNAAADKAALSVANANTNSGGLAFNAGDNTGSSLTSYPAAGSAVTFDDPSQSKTITYRGDAVTVTGFVNAPISFGSIVGFNPTPWRGSPATHAQSVRATATVIVAAPCSLAQGQAVLPFGLVVNGAPVNTSLDTPGGEQYFVDYTKNQIYYQMHPDASHPTLKASDYQGVELILKSGSWSGNTIGTSGNFGLLNLDGSNGKRAIGDQISGTSQVTVSIADPAGQDATAPGNAVGPVAQGLATRLGASGYDNANTKTNSQDTISRIAYNQWYDAGQLGGWGPSFYQDSRVVAIPLIAPVTNGGNTSVQIVGFAGLFLEGVNGKNSNVSWTTNSKRDNTGTSYSWTAGPNDVVGRFIFLTVNGDGGPCTTGGGVVAPILIR